MFEFYKFIYNHPFSYSIYFFNLRYGFPYLNNNISWLNHSVSVKDKVYLITFKVIEIDIICDQIIIKIGYVYENEILNYRRMQIRMLCTYNN